MPVMRTTLMSGYARRRWKANSLPRTPGRLMPERTASTFSFFRASMPASAESTAMVCQPRAWNSVPRRTQYVGSSSMTRIRWTSAFATRVFFEIFVFGPLRSRDDSTPTLRRPTAVAPPPSTTTSKNCRPGNSQTAGAMSLARRETFIAEREVLRRTMRRSWEASSPGSRGSRTRASGGCFSRISRQAPASAASTTVWPVSRKALEMFFRVSESAAAIRIFAKFRSRNCSRRSGLLLPLRADESLDPLHELLRGEVLLHGQVRARRLRQPERVRAHRVPSRHRDDRDPLRLGVHFENGIDAVLPGHVHVHDDEIERPLLERLDTLLAVLRPLRFEAALREGGLHAAADHPVVVDDEDARHPEPPPGTPSPCECTAGDARLAIYKGPAGNHRGGGIRAWCRRSAPSRLPGTPGT